MNDLLNIENKIVVIRGQQVMLDRDLAEIYGYETKNFNRQVRNNIEKFDEDFMFQLTHTEVEELSRCNFFTSIMQTGGMKGGRVYLPDAFTEQGIYMLMTVLKGDLAVKQSKELIRLFKKMRQFFAENGNIINRLNTVENKVDLKFLEYDKNFSKIFNVLDSSPNPIKQGIFIQGQIFDAYIIFQDLIQKAQKEIILIDNYIDLSVLERLSKKKDGVKVTIYTKSDTSITNLDEAKFNSQYPTLEIKYTTAMHDRFLIIDKVLRLNAARRCQMDKNSTPGLVRQTLPGTNLLIIYIRSAPGVKLYGGDAD